MSLLAQVEYGEYMKRFSGERRMFVELIENECVYARSWRTISHIPPIVAPRYF